MVNIGNFVWTTVATPPSPALSGTTVTIPSGHGLARFDDLDVPFQAVIGPWNEEYTKANTEVVTVTARTEDTLTIVRQQENSNARVVIAGDRLSVAITQKVLQDLEDAGGTGGGNVSVASAERSIDKLRAGGLDVVGTFGELDQTQMDNFKQLGGNAIVIQAYWDRLQSSSGAALNGTDVTALHTQFTRARNAGLMVVFECALQYPPNWVKTSVPKFKDQAGTEWSTAEGGKDVRDWVWSAVGWAAVQDFITKVWAVLTEQERAQIETVRTGFGYYGETQFPPVSGLGTPFQWWGYSDPAKGTGIAPDQTANPWPAYSVFSGDDAKDRAVVAWYRQSSINRMRGLVNCVRAQGWEGKIHVLHPSWGVRSNWGDWAPAETGWVEQNAQGVDWYAQMMQYPDDNVWPWSTHVAATDFMLSPVPSDWAPWRYLADCARRAGRALHLWGENTGGENGPQMGTMFTEGAMAQQYSGLFWLNWDSLNANDGRATLTDLQANLNLLRLEKAKNLSAGDDGPPDPGGDTTFVVGYSQPPTDSNMPTNIVWIAK